MEMIINVKVVANGFLIYSSDIEGTYVATDLYSVRYVIEDFINKNKIVEDTNE